MKDDAWGSEGQFTIANSLDDVVSATHFVRSRYTVREFDVDPSCIAIIGYSYGGGMALLGSLNDAAVRRIVYVAGGDLSDVARMMLQSDDFKRAFLKMVDQGATDSGFDSPPAEELFAEVFANMNKYDVVKQVGALSNRNILMIGGLRDQENAIEHHMVPLCGALHRIGAKHVQMQLFDTDHSFPDVKIQLADRIIAWLRRTPSKDTTRK